MGGTRRYTCLGAIVLGTATMAALSMLDALDQVFGPIWPVLILVALFWGAFICGRTGKGRQLYPHQ
jgi:hypothetical protein